MKVKIFCQAIPVNAPARRCGLCGGRSDYFLYAGDADGNMDKSSRRTVCAKCRTNIFKPKDEPARTDALIRKVAEN